MNKPRDNGGGQAKPEFTSNQISTFDGKLSDVLKSLHKRKLEIEAVLPPDLTYNAFYATINQALRANPDLLECTTLSLVNAAVKSAYDGLRCDGREAALVSHNVKIQVRGQPDRWEKQAQYFPMVQGLIKQILMDGRVVAIEADVIHENDMYDIQGGTDAHILHKPLMVGDRGKPIAAYSIAVLANGSRTGIYLREDQIIDIAKASKSGWDEKASTFKGIWLRWWRQMWLKTTIRQHRKTLPVGRIRDAEMIDEFPQFDRQTAHPQLPPLAAKPTRSDPALTHDQSVGYDLGTRQREEVTIDNGAGQERAKASVSADQQQQTTVAAAVTEPEGGWSGWAMGLEHELKASGDMGELEQLWAADKLLIDAAPPGVRDDLASIFSDRAADLAADEAAGAGAGDDD